MTLFGFPMCAVDRCDRLDHKARGLCNAHYQRFLKGGSLDAPVRPTYASDWCSVDGCRRKRHAKGLCSTHYARVREHGSASLPLRQPARFVTARGYVMVSDSAHPNANSSGSVFEHRLVMSEALGPPAPARRERPPRQR